LILFTIEQLADYLGRVLTVDRDGGLSIIDQLSASYVTIILVCQPFGGTMHGKLRWLDAAVTGSAKWRKTTKPPADWGRQTGETVLCGTTLANDTTQPKHRQNNGKKMNLLLILLVVVLVAVLAGVALCYVAGALVENSSNTKQLN
jgi:hypothetical protein